MDPRAGDQGMVDGVLRRTQRLFVRPPIDRT
jgi:hypothetical protein